MNEMNPNPYNVNRGHHTKGAPKDTADQPEQKPQTQQAQNQDDNYSNPGRRPEDDSQNPYDQNSARRYSRGQGDAVDASGAAPDDEDGSDDEVVDDTGHKHRIPKQHDEAVADGDDDVINVKLHGTRATLPPNLSNDGSPLTDDEIDELQKSLQKTGINAEIKIKPDGVVTLRYIDDQDRNAEFHIPANVVASIASYLSGTPTTNIVNANTHGALIDQKA
jgi:hypothetical protein